MKKILWNFIVVIYVIIAITVTFCLLNYNDNKITQIGDKSLIIISDSELEPDYSDGDLVIVSNKNISNVNSGEKIFFYLDDVIKIGNVEKVNKYEGMSSTFVVDGGTQIIEDDVIGSATTAKTFGTVGKVLSVLESKWGFLFLIIFPSLLAFINEIFQVITEIKYGGEDKNKKYGKNDNDEKEE